MTNWIIQSDLEIQELHHDWNFLRAEIEFDTVAGDWSYTPVIDITAITKFAQWKTDELRVYLKSAGYGSETRLGAALAYDAFRDYWRFNMRRSTQSRPVSWAVAPDHSLVLGPVGAQLVDSLSDVVGAIQLRHSSGDREDACGSGLARAQDSAAESRRCCGDTLATNRHRSLIVVSTKYARRLLTKSCTKEDACGCLSESMKFVQRRGCLSSI